MAASTAAAATHSSIFMAPEATLQWPLIHVYIYTLTHQWVDTAMQGAAAPLGAIQCSVSCRGRLNH